MELDHEKNILTTQLEIQEQTFRNISQEIHDNISLSLTLAKLQLNTYSMKDSKPGGTLIESSVDLISKALSDLNDISKSMDSDLIETHGLIHAIEFEIQLLQKTGLHEVEFIVIGEPFFMEAAKELVIFRIIQESCNNILKHSEAKTIYIKLNYQDNLLEVQVRDDGKGFDPHELLNRSSQKPFSGLKNIKNRADLIKASARIESLVGTGTTITLLIPYTKTHANTTH
jgi:two-component system, NarL family, sensor kinase